MQSLKSSATKHLDMSSVKSLLEELEENGASISHIEGESLTRVFNISHGDKAWKIYEDWASKFDNDPHVSCFFAPPLNIINTVLCPPVQLVGNIQNEALSIIWHYSSLRVDDFELSNPPFIPGPMVAPRPRVNFPHPTMALSALFCRIKNPPLAYPTISGLNSGSYIVTVFHDWSTVHFEFNLFKD